nr:subtilisin-like protease SBT3.18 [Tanacetum cinerariifolium]
MLFGLVLLGRVLGPCLVTVLATQPVCRPSLVSCLPSLRESLPSVPDAYGQSLEALLSQSDASERAETRVHTPAPGESEAQNELPGSILSSEPKPLVQHRPPPLQSVWSPGPGSWVLVVYSGRWSWGAWGVVKVAGKMGKRAVDSHYRSPRDANGHGTHMASTEVCWEDGKCSEADVLAPFDEAIHDGVNVILASFGSPPPLVPLLDSSSDIGSFHAMQKGISVVFSAGNNGPDPSLILNVIP